MVEEVFDEDRPVFSRQSLFLFTFRKKIPKVTQQVGKAVQQTASSVESKKYVEGKTSTEPSARAAAKAAAPLPQEAMSQLSSLASLVR